MRRLQTGSLEFTRIGKITLAILAGILTLLVYGRASAQELDLLVQAKPFEEIKEELSDQKYNLTPKTDEDQAQAEAIVEDKKPADRVIYNPNSIYPVVEDNQCVFSKEDRECQTPPEPAVDEELKSDVSEELAGTLMEPMIEEIASFDRETAALLVGIAKIESGYSHNYSYNFWGYAGGYHGFKTPEQAVKTVGKRIRELKNQGLNTPQKIVTTWKCGQSCASHAPGSVERWVATVSGPYNRIAMK